MSIVITILTVLLVICGLLAIIVVMIQDDQGEGFALFGSSGQNPFNSGRNPLARLTGYLGIAFAVLALLAAVTVSWSANQRSRLEQLSRENVLEDNDWFLPSVDAEEETNVAASTLEPAAVEAESAADEPPAEPPAIEQETTP